MLGVIGMATGASADTNKVGHARLNPGEDVSETNAAAASAALNNQAPSPPTTATLPAAQNGDPTWTAVKLHRLNMMEIQAGKAEQANGQSPRVKSFAAHMVRDHQAADRQLAAYAKKHKITLRGSEFGPPQNDDNTASGDDAADLQARADLKALKQHKGRDMDQAFLTAMITGHDNAITMVREARAATTDSELSSLLDQLLPSLQRHRDTASTLNNAINGTSSSE
ncbi:MAG TPA: DUF4142 domain-containing protein [Polyangia bacterium]|nr:DUF4142 domain-containing protein [Polyangia bacterium]